LSDEAFDEWGVENEATAAAAIAAGKAVEGFSRGKLCILCEDLFDDWDAVVRGEDSQWSPEALAGAPRGSNGLSEEPKVTRKHHSTLRALQASVSGGCSFCALLFQSFREEHTENFTDFMITPEEHSNGHLWLYLKSGHSGGKWAAEVRFDGCSMTHAEHVVDLLPVLDTGAQWFFSSRF
jgi:hypothetical protein